MAGRIGPYKRVITDGLVLDLDASNRYSYPGTGTSWTDLSGNGNNGTLIGEPSFNSGNGGSIVFDGSNDRVNLGTTSILKFTNNFTINIWFKFNTLLGFQAIISNNENGGYGIIANPGNSRLETFYWVNGYKRSGDSMTNYNTSSWFNVSVSFNGNNIIFYRNGNLIENVSAIGTVSTTNEPLTIGANPIGNGASFSDFFNGRIAIIQLYNRALSAAEVLQNYNATKGRFGL
jgi:hypothetical protein